MVSKNARSEDSDLFTNNNSKKQTIPTILPSTQLQQDPTQETLIDDLEYEDAYEDIEQDIQDPFDVTIDALDSDSNFSDEIQILDKEEDEEEDEGQTTPIQTYLPGQSIDENQVLVPDNSAYECLHSLSVEWPCLSFDILKDGLGENRSTVNTTLYFIRLIHASIYIYIYIRIYIYIYVCISLVSSFCDGCHWNPSRSIKREQDIHS